MKFIIPFLISILLGFFQTNLLQAQACLDVSFGINGTVRASVPGGQGYDAANAVAIQPDGRIVVVGTSYTMISASSYGWKFALARLDTDGSPDSTFGTNGFATTWISDGNNSDDEATCVLIQPDGKILVGGFSYISMYGGNRFAVARFKSDGQIDGSFGTNGTATGEINGVGNDHAYCIALQSDGKIVLGGGSNPNSDFMHHYYAVMRLTANGALDGTFGTSGGSWLYTNTDATGMVVQPDDKIIVAGPSSLCGMARFKANGSVDLSFGTDGEVANGSAYYSVALQAGKIVASTAYAFSVTRFDSNGNVDSTFGTDGTSSYSVAGGAGNDHDRAIAVQPDGKIIIVGDSYDLSGNDLFGIERLNADGSLDNSFAGVGSARFAINGGSSTNDRAFSVAVQGDGKVLAAGTSTGTSGGTAFALARLLQVTEVPLAAQACSFETSCLDNSVTISWKTQSELNNAGFEILREGQGRSGFNLLSSYADNNALKGLGTSTSGRSYKFTDVKVAAGMTYRYKIRSVSTSGESRDITTLTVTVYLAQKYALYQNFPNPFNPATTIRYDLQSPAKVRITLFDMIGREVATLVDDHKEAGSYQFSFDASKVASGTYFYKIVAVGSNGELFSSMKKLVVMK